MALNQNELFDYITTNMLYDKENGILIWKKKVGRNKIGKQVGSKCKGYLQVKIKGKSYFLHSLIFLIEYGFIPKEINHIDKNRSNNIISNLECVTRLQNMQNKSKYKINTTGYTGVQYRKKQNDYIARIKVYKQEIFLGVFNTFEEAKNARIMAERIYKVSSYYKRSK